MSVETGEHSKRSSDEARQQRKRKQKEIRKSKTLRGCDKMLQILVSEITSEVPTTLTNNAGDRSKMIAYRLELAKSLKTVLKQYEVKDSLFLEEFIKSGNFSNALETFHRTPRPPFHLIMEMGQVLHQEESAFEDWLRQMCGKMRLDEGRENPLVPNTFCRARKAKNHSWGACVGSFARKENLREYFIDGLKKEGWFHPKVIDALESVKLDEVTRPVDSKTDIECAAFQFQFERKYEIGPCYRCKKLYPNVMFVPDCEPDQEDEGFPWGNCAENYAISKMLKLSTDQS